MYYQKFLLTFCLSVCVLITIHAQSRYSPREVAAPQAHYKELTKLDSKPSKAYSWMDTITYPRKEVATGTLAATMLRTVYLIEDVPALLDIPKFPANSSEQTREELKLLLKFQQERTEEQINRYRKLAGIFHSPGNFNPLDPDYDRNFSSLFHIGSPLGEWYNYKNLPLTAKLLSGVYRDAMYYVFRLKVELNRPRPYHLEPKLNALEKPMHQSYPSGHSSGSYANAYVITEIAPQLANEFLKMAEEMAISREYLGCHYPSDSEMGRKWARLFVNELFKKQKFINDFEAAKKEIADFQKKQALINTEVNNASRCSLGEADSGCGNSCDADCSNSCCSSDH